MYYDNKNQIIVNQLPKNSIGPDGQLYVNFNQINDINLWAEHGYFSVRNDLPQKPSELHEEDVNKRIITIDYPYADITRVWMDTSSVINEPIHSIPEQSTNIDVEL